MELPEIDTQEGTNIEEPSQLPGFVVVGEKKGVDPIEEFWMQKLTKVEEQYEEHITKLERALLEKRISRRVVCRQGEQLTKIKEQFHTKKKESEKLLKQSSKFQHELSEQRKENAKLEDRLSQLVSKYMETDKEGKVNRAQVRKCNNQMLSLRRKLKQLEKEKRLLTQEVDTKEEEKQRCRQKQSDMARQRVLLVKNLKTVDTERTVQTVTNIKLSQNLAQVLEDATLRDKRIQLLRKELDETAENMKKQRSILEGTLNQKRNSDKKLLDTKDVLEKSTSRLDDLSTQILGLKEEVDYAETTTAKQSLELKTVKSENRYLRSQLAELTHHLTKVQGDLKSLETQRDRMEIELRKMKSQDVAIQNLMRQNALQRFKLNQKVSSQQQQHHLQLPPLRKSSVAILEDPNDYVRDCPSKQVDGYRKKVGELERKLRELERKIDDGKRKENLYRLKLKRFSATKEELFWTHKAMLRLDADRHGMEQMIKSFATTNTIPRKMPFEKLVTDPSILDRIAKQKVLQKRLATQSAHVERMRDIVQHLVQHEQDRKAEGLTGPRAPESLEPWQLNYWRDRKGESRVGRRGDFPQSETKSGYYKDYVGFLKQEIPRIKNELILLERKKQYLRAQRAASQSRSGSVSIVDLDAEDYIPSSPDHVTEESEDEDEEEEEEDAVVPLEPSEEDATPTTAPGTSAKDTE